MYEPKPSEKALEPYRVLDLADETGSACGKVLADLGADVIKVERPGGDVARNIGPFYGDIPHPEKSLFWFAYNGGKRSLTLNIESAEGQEIFQKLVAKADFVVESFSPGYMDRLGLGYAHLSRANPRIITISITPFGQTGPYKDFKGSELLMWAMSGMMNLTGEPGEAPVQVSIPHLYYRAGAQAAAAGLMALHWRESTGEGQSIDISIRDVIVWSVLHVQQIWDMNKVNVTREGAARQFGPTRLRFVFRCRDGCVVFRLFGGPAFAPGQRALVEWMDTEGVASDFLKGIKWEEIYAATASTTFAEQVGEAFGRFFLTKTKSELWQGSLERQIPLAPATTVDELLETTHVVPRDFWRSIEHDELNDSITYPGPPARLSVTPWETRRRAPLIGEHNVEVYQGELGLTRENLLCLKAAQVI